MLRRRGAAAYKSCAPTNEAGPPRFSTAVSRRAGVNDALVPRDVVDRSQSGKALASSTVNILGLRAKASKSLFDVEDSGKFDRRARRREL